eukprot:6478025-Amphidinium_carterae.1
MVPTHLQCARNGFGVRIGFPTAHLQPRHSVSFQILPSEANQNSEIRETKQTKRCALDASGSEFRPFQTNAFRQK